MELIDQLCLYHAIFTDPSSKSLAKPDTSRWHIAYKCLDALIQNPSPGSLGQLLVRSNEANYVAWNLAALSPWMTMDFPADDAFRKANALPAVSVTAREGFKAPNKLTDTITSSYRNRREIMDMKQSACSKAPVLHARDTLGMAIRKWDSQGGPWTLQVLNALLVEVMESLDTWSEPGGKGT